VVLNYHGFFDWAEESPAGWPSSRRRWLKPHLRARSVPARWALLLLMCQKNKSKGILSGKNIERSGRIEILINKNLELHSFFWNLLHIAGKNDDFNQKKKVGGDFSSSNKQELGQHQHT
jgi:hypothetical protein